MLNEIPTQSSDSSAVRCRAATCITKATVSLFAMRITPLALLPLLLFAAPARAEVLHITRDHGGYVEEYKTKYQRIRAKGERVVIDGICNSACTLVFGIVPMNKICVT